MNLFFIDESCSEELQPKGDRLYALTGVLVPAGRYDEARTRFYRLLSERVDWSGREIRTRDGQVYRVADGVSVDQPPPELHGRKLLPDRDDDEKIRACERAIQVVSESELLIHRVCLTFDRATRRKYKGDDAPYLECWPWLMTELSPTLERESVVPIIDIGNRQITETIPQINRLRDFFRSVHPNPLWRDPAANLLGELYFANSRDSVFVQVADIVSYILLARDYLAAGWPGTPWKARIAGVSSQLPPRLLKELRGRLVVRGSQRSVAPLSA